MKKSTDANKSFLSLFLTGFRRRCERATARGPDPPSSPLLRHDPPSFPLPMIDSKNAFAGGSVGTSPPPLRIPPSKRRRAASSSPAHVVAFRVTKNADEHVVSCTRGMHPRQPRSVPRLARAASLSDSIISLHARLCISRSADTLADARWRRDVSAVSSPGAPAQNVLRRARAFFVFVHRPSLTSPQRSTRAASSSRIPSSLASSSSLAALLQRRHHRRRPPPSLRRRTKSCQNQKRHPPRARRAARSDPPPGATAAPRASEARSTVFVLCRRRRRRHRRIRRSHSWSHTCS